MDQDDVTSVVEKLIETCRDGQKRYQDAAEHIQRYYLKTFFQEQWDKTIVESVEQGEDTAKETYQKALDSSLPPSLATIVSRQAQSIKDAHDEMKSVRRYLAA